MPRKDADCTQGVVALTPPCEVNTIADADARHKNLLLWRDDMLVIFIDDFLHLCVDELIERVQLLPHQSLLIEVRGDNGPRIFLLPQKSRLAGRRFAGKRLRLTDHFSEC